MAAIRMAAIVALTLAEDTHVAPGNVFSVETQEEALRLEEIGAARIILDGGDGPEGDASEGAEA